MYDKRIAGGLSKAALATWNGADVRKMRRATEDYPAGLWLTTEVVNGGLRNGEFGKTTATWYMAPDEIAALDVSPSRTKH